MGSEVCEMLEGDGCIAEGEEAAGGGVAVLAHRVEEQMLVRQDELHSRGGGKRAKHGERLAHGARRFHER